MAGASEDVCECPGVALSSGLGEDLVSAPEVRLGVPHGQPG